MSVNVSDNIECWSLMEFGCDLADTFQPRLFCSLTLCCCFGARTVYFTLHVRVFSEHKRSPIMFYDRCA